MYYEYFRLDSMEKLRIPKLGETFTILIKKRLYDMQWFATITKSNHG